MRRQKGITIVSLVVTIIVLIILAGVTINATIGDNGIITIARRAKENMELAQEQEQKELNELYESIGAEGGISGGLSYDIIAKFTEYREKVAEAITNKGIPTSDTDSIETVVENIEKLGNESTIKKASYDSPYIPTGFTHTGEGTWNSGYVIKETATGNEFVWVPCVLDQSKVKEGDTVVTFGKIITGKYNSNNFGITGEEGTSATEIEASVGRYGGFYIARYEAGIGGTTDNNSLTTKTATDGSIKPLSQAGKGVWNYISRADAITVSKAMIDETTTGAKSALISGAAWDTTLQWMVNASDNKDNEPNLGYDEDSTGNGWYSDVSANKVTTTGKYSVNNIYDMAGNVFEYTTENCTSNGSSYVVLRGGGFHISSSSAPAALRSYSNFSAINYIGLRIVLYKSDLT